MAFLYMWVKNGVSLEEERGIWVRRYFLPVILFVSRLDLSGLTVPFALMIISSFQLPRHRTIVSDSRNPVSRRTLSLRDL